MTSVELNPKHVAAVMAAGFRWFEQGRLQDAKRIFEGLTVLDKSNCYAHGLLGAIYQRQKDYDAAISRYTTAISLFSKDPNLYTNRGEIYLKLGRFEEAAEDLKRSIDLDSTGKHPAANRARLLIRAVQQAIQRSASNV